MLVTTLSADLMRDYGRDTVATWCRFTQRKVVVIAVPDEAAPLEDMLGKSYAVLPFGPASLQHMAAIRAREQALNHRRDDYRFQASRFSWKVFALHEAFTAFPEQQVLTWLDADSLVRDGFDHWLDRTCSAAHAVSFLGRSHKQLHAETGLINFAGPEARRLFQRVLDAYTSLDLFEYREWHDAYIFTSVFQFSKHCFDICKHQRVRSSNPLYEIDRGRHIMHLKGMRKTSPSHLLDSLRVWLGR